MSLPQTCSHCGALLRWERVDVTDSAGGRAPGWSYARCRGCGWLHEIDDAPPAALAPRGNPQPREVDVETALKLPQDARLIVRDIAEGIRGRPPEDHLDPWPAPNGTPIEFQPAILATEVMHDLIGRLERFSILQDATVTVLYRNKDWKKGGKTVFGEMKLANGLLGYFADTDYVLLINWRIWQAMNPWQRVALVYHELRHADQDDKAKPALQPHDAEVFFDELEVFGVKTFSDWSTLAASADQGATVTQQFALSLFVEPTAEGAPTEPQAEAARTAETPKRRRRPKAEHTPEEEAEIEAGEAEAAEQLRRTTGE